LNKGKPMKRNDHLINTLQYMVSLKPKPRFASTYTANPNLSYT
jgi:hypothetical protein